jgi:hypothetical protein
MSRGSGPKLKGGGEERRGGEKGRDEERRD